jgi:hypothetical protein
MIPANWADVQGNSSVTVKPCRGSARNRPNEFGPTAVIQVKTIAEERQLRAAIGPDACYFLSSADCRGLSGLWG